MPSIDWLRMARGRAIAPAVVRRTKKGAALDDLARNPHGAVALVVAVGLTPASGIFGDAARLRRIRSVPGREPILGPFPHIADHIEEAIAVGRKRSDRRGALITVGGEIFVGKRALPGICHLTAARREFITPGKFSPVEAAARGVLPLGFGRQVLARPSGIGFSVSISDMHHRVIVEALIRATPTVWVGASSRRIQTATIATSRARSTGCRGGVNTSEPGFNIFGNAPG